MKSITNLGTFLWQAELTFIHSCSIWIVVISNLKRWYQPFGIISNGQVWTFEFYVNKTYDAETEMIPRRWSDETETLKSDGIEMRPRRSKTPRDRLKTETFETETTTLA